MLIKMMIAVANPTTIIETTKSYSHSWKAVSQDCWDLLAWSKRQAASPVPMMVISSMNVVDMAPANRISRS